MLLNHCIFTYNNLKFVDNLKKKRKDKIVLEFSVSDIEYSNKQILVFQWMILLI